MSPLLVRCEATPALGTGHALRCLALALEWRRRGGRAVFALAEPDPGIVARLCHAGIGVEVLRGAAGSGEDARETGELARRLQARWTVIDGPQFAAEWEAGWPGATALLRIDDNGRAGPFRGDLLLNQNLGAAPGDYPAAPGSCRLLLGPDFALLRPEFLAVGATARTTRIVVSMGGSDPAGATERVLAALAEDPANALAADFVVGSANPRVAGLLAMIARHGPRLCGVHAPADLPERFAAAAFAVTAGGTTLYELALLRTPMFVLCTAENQRRTCERFAAAGAAHYAGGPADLPPARLAEQLAGFAADRERQRQLVARAATLVDGRGAHRVVEAMLSGGGAA